MSHQLIGTIEVLPDKPVPGQSVLVQVFDSAGNLYDDSGSAIITIDGCIGARRYLQFARPGHRYIHVTAASNGVIETATTDLTVRPFESSEDTASDTDRSTIRPYSLQKRIADLPLLHAGSVYGYPYQVSFSVGGHAPFKRSLARQSASLRRVETRSDASANVAPTAEEYEESRFDGYSGITGKLTGDPQLKPADQHHIIEQEDSTVSPAEKNSSYLDEAIAQALTKYQWDFGDGHVETTDSHRVEHDYRPSLDPTKPYQLFDVSLSIQKPDGSMNEVKRTLTIHNAYAICKEHGVIAPQVDQVEFAEVDLLGFSARLRAHNVETYPLVLSEYRFQAYSNDPEQNGVLSEISKLDPPVVLSASSIKEISVYAPFAQVPRQSAGFTAYYFGTTDDGQPVRIEATFETRAADRDSDAVTIGGGLAVGQLRGYERISRAQIVTSQAQVSAAKDAILAEAVAVITAYGDTVTEIAPSATQQMPLGVQVSPTQPLKGAVCDPDNLPNLTPEQIAAGWTCQATAEVKEVSVPARFVNAMKGDIVLAPGSGLIGGLLRQVVPPQRYDHTGIMTRNFDQITHATACVERLLDYPIGTSDEPTDGFEPNAMKYMWPGVVTQSVEDTIFGEPMIDPDNGKTYEISSFGPGAIGADVAGVWEIIPQLVVKPDPRLETPEIREKLHRVADDALAQTGKSHYRLYCYTDPTIGQRPEGKAPPSAGWAAGTYPSVCSSFIWMMLKRQNIQLESSRRFVRPSDLEIHDVVGGAQVENTLDGLYLYSKEERIAGGEWLKDELTRMVEQFLEAKTEAFDGVVDFFTDIADDVSNHMLNTFASDWADTAAKDSEAWRDMHDANAVSPDNILFWDGPPDGLYGYAVPLVYRSPRLEQVVVHRWRQERKLGALSGHVYYKKQPVKHALVQLYDGKTTYSDNAGGYAFKEIPIGDYELKAYKNALEDGIDGSDRIRVTINEGEQVADLNLALPADYHRRVTIVAKIETTDDELLSDEHATDRYHKEVFVGPWNTHAKADFEQRMGGEIRIELQFEVDLNRDRSVTVTARAKMFEGYTESTDELEDTEETTIVVRKNNTGVGSIRLYNDGLGAGDKSNINFAITNLLEN